MRVLAVTNMFPTDEHPASGVFVERQVTALKRVGLDVDVLFFYRLKYGMKVYRRLDVKLRERAKAFKPDIVHVLYGGVLADRASRAGLNCPLVVSFCGSDLLGENRSGLIRKFISYWGVRASHKAARRASGIVVVARNLMNALPDDIDRSHIQIIPHFLDLELFRPIDRNQCMETLGWSPDRFHVLFPSHSGDMVKRPELARAAVETLRARGVPVDLHMVAGVQHMEMPTWFNASHVFLLTSLHEGSPNMLREALACDVPVVSVDVGDAAERLAGVNGCFLAEPRADDLADKLQKVWNSKKRIRGRDRLAEVSMEASAKRTRDFYQSLLAAVPS